jgi:hypothetical protein
LASRWNRPPPVGDATGNVTSSAPAVVMFTWYFS